MGLLDFKKVLEQSKRDLLDKPKEALLGNKNEILGKEEKPEKSNLIGFDNEKGFESQGIKQEIFRYKQALSYGKGVYGMDCNACCVMYFLQSYGLIPPVIKRKRFEYAFTPLTPSRSLFAKEKESSKAKFVFIPDEDSNKDNSSISEKGNVIPVNNNLFDNMFPKGAEYYLRGFDGGGAIFPHIENSSSILKKIFLRFYDLSKIDSLKFLKSNYDETAISELLDGGVRNKYEQLVNGIGASYFKKHIIFVGLAHLSPMPGHYCLIVNTPTETVVEGISFWVYPADDPFYGKSSVYVPKGTISNLSVMANLIEQQYGRFLIFPNCAIGV
jgi:hypothetical protein